MRDRPEVEDELDQMLDALTQFSIEDALLMAQLWSEEDQAARQRAWQRAKITIERAGLSDLLDSAREEVGDWLRATPADYQGISGLLGREGDHVSYRRAAAPAALDAIVAMLARDELFSADYDVLSRPWRVAREEEGPPEG